MTMPKLNHEMLSDYVVENLWRSDFFGSGPGFVNRTQSDPGFVNPVRSGPGFVNAPSCDSVSCDAHSSLTLGKRVYKQHN